MAGVDDGASVGAGVADVAFGRCVVLVSQRTLLIDGAPVELGDRAFELLLALIDGRGRHVTKDQLMARVWPGRIVEENTLEGRISLLRRSLGADRTAIRTIAGRGYQFVAEPRAVVTAAAASAVAVVFPPLAPLAAAAVAGHPLPSRVSMLIGRATALVEITELARDTRLLTLVGTGGIGKTRLAVEAARMLAPAFSDGAYLAELGSVTAPASVPMAVAVALGLPLGDGAAGLGQMAAALRAKHVLLVLDNCEHVIGAAAHLVEHLLRAAPGVCIIATTREALRIEGEYVYRVASLDVPDEEGAEPGVLAASGALQLFQARLGGSAGEGASGRELALQVRICRRLDGIPLALELAAARVAVLGLEGVATRLDDRFQLLTNGARTALPRQQTLRATLDWSYDLLPAPERAVLGQLSIFAGHFSLASASAIVAAPDVDECIASLVGKSLVVVAAVGAHARYKLLETTRVYAREKLRMVDSGEQLARAHALHYLALFEAGEAEARAGVTAAWRACHAPHLEDYRAAASWAFGASGDAALGVRLALAGMPLSLQLGLLQEGLARVDLALAWVERHDAGDDICRMKLYAARGTALLYQAVSQASGAAFEQALALADRLGDVAHQKLGVWGSWCYSYLNGDYGTALVLAQRFHRLAAGGTDSDSLVADRIVGITHLCLGHLAQSRAALERMLDAQPASGMGASSIRFLYDEQMLGRTSLAHTLYLQGYPEQAVRQASLALAGAQALAHVPSLCYALSEGVCAIALLVGDHATLAQATLLLDSATRQHGMSTWKARARIWLALPQLLDGQDGVYDQAIAPALAEIGVARFFISLTPLLTTVALALGEQDRCADGLALLDPALAQARISGDACSLVELMRAHALLVAMRGEGGDAACAEQLLAGALASAHAQGFLSWELRCMVALAGLQQQGVPANLDALRAVQGRFSEGWDCADLSSARGLLGREQASG